MSSDNQPIPQFIRRLMPAANEAELHEATQTFKDYMAVVLRMYERIKQDHLEADSPKLESHDRVRNAQHL